MFDTQIEYDANFDSNQAKGNQTQTIDAHGGCLHSSLRYCIFLHVFSLEKLGSMV